MRREKLKAKSNEFLNKEKESLAKWTENLKKDPDRYGKFKEDDKLRKWAAKKRKEVPEAANSEVPEAGNSEGYTQENAQTPGSSFSCKQTLHRSLSRAFANITSESFASIHENNCSVNKLIFNKRVIVFLVFIC